MNGFEMLIAIVTIVTFIGVVNIQPGKVDKIVMGTIFGGLLVCMFIFVGIMTRPR